MLLSRRSSWSAASPTLGSSSQIVPSSFSSDASSAASADDVAPGSRAALELDPVESPVDLFLVPSRSIEAALDGNGDRGRSRRAHWSVGALPSPARSVARRLPAAAAPALPSRKPPPNQPLPQTPGHPISSFSTFSRRTSSPPPPPPARSHLRPLPQDVPSDPSEQLRQQVHRQRASWVEYLASAGLVQEHQRQSQARKGSVPTLSREPLPLPPPSQHQRTPSAPDYSPSVGRRGSPVSVSAYSGTSSTLQQAVVARRPERPGPGARSISADYHHSLQPPASSKNARSEGPNSALLNALHLPERAADQNKQAAYPHRIETTIGTRSAWPIDHVPRESLELDLRSSAIRVSKSSEIVIRIVDSPTFFDQDPSSSQRASRSAELPRPPTRHGPTQERKSRLSSELLEIYLAEQASSRHAILDGQEPQRLNKGKNKMEKHASDQIPPSTARSNFTFSQASDLEQGLSRNGSTRQHADAGRAGATSVNASHNDGSYLAASDLEAGGEREPDEEDEEDESTWGPLHPCFPHLNPHVPISSPLHQSTRIIRIKRDYLVAGDLAPTYSNLYPEILDPWVSEEDFRDLVKGINDRLVEAYNPFALVNIMDIFLALITFWLWDDLGFTFVKRRLRALELWLVQWNALKAKQAAVAAGGTKLEGANGGGLDLVKVYPLRNTAFLSIDIQIPDPKLPAFATADDPVSTSNHLDRPDTQETATAQPITA